MYISYCPLTGTRLRTRNHHQFDSVLVTRGQSSQSHRTLDIVKKRRFDGNLLRKRILPMSNKINMEEGKQTLLVFDQYRNWSASTRRIWSLLNSFQLTLAEVAVTLVALSLGSMRISFWSSWSESIIY